MFRNVAVLGAGTMGHGLALVHALAGANVTITDVQPETLARAAGLIRAAFDVLVESGEIEAHAPHPSSAPPCRRWRRPCPMPTPSSKPRSRMPMSSGTARGNSTGLRHRDRHREQHVEPRRLPAGPRPVAGTHADRALVRAALHHRSRILSAARGPTGRIERVRACGRHGQATHRPQSLHPGHRQPTPGRLTREVLPQALPARGDRRIHPACPPRCRSRHVKSDFGGLALTQRLIANGSYRPPPSTDHYEILDRLIAEGRTTRRTRLLRLWGRPPDELLADRDRRLIASASSHRDRGLVPRAIRWVGVGTPTRACRAGHSVHAAGRQASSGRCARSSLDDLVSSRARSPGRSRHAPCTPPWRDAASAA